MDVPNNVPRPLPEKGWDLERLGPRRASTQTRSSLPVCKAKLSKASAGPGIRVKIEDASLWEEFHSIGTEMIINRCGRRMFPPVSVSITGLEETMMYEVHLKVVPADDRRYKFSGNKWVSAGKADPGLRHDTPNVFQETPCSGRHLMATALSFSKIKLTNSKDNRNGCTLLHSMHKYMVEISILPVSNLLMKQGVYVFPLPLTDFIAVTAYQNEAIIQLKIQHNPFAKAFRDGNMQRDSRILPTRVGTEAEVTREGKVPSAKMPDKASTRLWSVPGGESREPDFHPYPPMPFWGSPPLMFNPQVVLPVPSVMPFNQGRFWLLPYPPTTPRERLDPPPPGGVPRPSCSPMCPPAQCYMPYPFSLPPPGMDMKGYPREERQVKRQRLNEDCQQSTHLTLPVSIKQEKEESDNLQ